MSKILIYISENTTVKNYLTVQRVGGESNGKPNK
jgi:hypothetical protein